MGCDGGTIPRRNELVKVKQKPETRDQTSHLIFQWRYCNISQQLLRRPIVACGLGRLYNKSSIIEALINKNSIVPHVKSLRDTKDLKLTSNPVFRESALDQIHVAPFICPVSGLEMSGNFRFVVLWSCGCVLSERALKEIGVKTCPKCQNTFEDVDVVVLNPRQEEEKFMRERMQLRKKKKKCRSSVSHQNLQCEFGDNGSVLSPH